MSDWKSAQDALDAIHEAELVSDEVLEYELSAQGVERFPDSPELWARRAKHLWNLMREDESAAALANAFGLGPDCAAAWAVKSSVDAGDGCTDEALESARRALELDPDNPVVLYYCVDVYHATGDAATSVELTSRWCRVAPDALAYLQHIHSVSAANGRDKGLEALDEAERFYPSSVLLMRCRALYTMPTELAEAIRLFRICTEKSRRCSTAWSQLSMALVFADRFAEAKEAADRALELNPRAVNAMQSMARMCSKRGQQREAAEWLERAKNAIPGIGFASTLTSAGNAARAGQWQKSLTLLEPIIAAPSNTLRRTALGMKARALVELGRMSGAELVLDELEQMNWDESSRYELRGRILLAGRNRDRDGAVAQFLAGLEKYPTDGLIAAQLIRVWHGDKDAERDRESLVQGLLDNPPDMPWGLAAVARALLETGYRQQALKLRWVCQQRFPEATDCHMLSLGDWFRHIGRLFGMVLIMMLFGRRLVAGKVPKFLKGIVSVEIEEADKKDGADG